MTPENRLIACALAAADHPDRAQARHELKEAADAYRRVMLIEIEIGDNLPVAESDDERCGALSSTGAMSCYLKRGHALKGWDRERYRYHFGLAKDDSRRSWREWR